jgi:aspartyl-tRNA(Asn)/glutamyl-tRNA(Gln) amidotransferase subunit C
MSCITKETVKHLAELSRIAVSSEECELLASDLAELADLAHVLDVLPREADRYEGAVPYQALREDAVNPSFAREELLQAAAVRDGETVLVPRTVEE